MEDWLRQNLLNFVVVIATCSYAVGQIRRSAKSLQEHLADVQYPHRNCAVEAERYKNICDQLGKIEGTLKVLDARTVAILAGRPIRESDEHEAG